MQTMSKTTICLEVATTFWAFGIWMSNLPLEKEIAFEMAQMQSAAVGRYWYPYVLGFNRPLWFVEKVTIDKHLK